jgi:hypothetical protein
LAQREGAAINHFANYHKSDLIQLKRVSPAAAAGLQFASRHCGHVLITQGLCSLYFPSYLLTNIESIFAISGFLLCYSQRKKSVRVHACGGGAANLSLSSAVNISDFISPPPQSKSAEGLATAES